MEQAVTHDCKRSDDVWVAAASFVLEEAGVFAPVITDFDATPMSAYEFQPLLGRMAVDGLGTDVIAGSSIFGLLESS
jgi:hypothetical protein